MGDRAVYPLDPAALQQAVTMISISTLASEARLLLDHERGMTPPVVGFLERVLLCKEQLDRIQVIIDRFEGKLDDCSGNH